VTREEAIALAKSGWWRKATDEEIAVFCLNEPRLCCPWDVYHRSIEKLLGRPVFTHEFADPRKLLEEALA
jgi:hypothetical protein